MSCQSVIIKSFHCIYNKIRMDHCIVGHLLSISKNIVFLSLKNHFVKANSAGTDEMPHYGAFHLGLHNLQKYLFSSLYDGCRILLAFCHLFIF